jgi:hypothetical protein
LYPSFGKRVWKEGQRRGKREEGRGKREEGREKREEEKIPPLLFSLFSI